MIRRYLIWFRPWNIIEFLLSAEIISQIFHYVKPIAGLKPHQLYWNIRQRITFHQNTWAISSPSNRRTILYYNNVETKCFAPQQSDSTSHMFYPPVRRRDLSGCKCISINTFANLKHNPETLGGLAKGLTAPRALHSECALTRRNRAARNFFVHYIQLSRCVCV